MSNERVIKIMLFIQGDHALNDYYKDITSEDTMNKVLSEWLSFQIVGLYQVQQGQENPFLRTIQCKHKHWPFFN